MRSARIAAAVVLGSALLAACGGSAAKGPRSGDTGSTDLSGSPILRAPSNIAALAGAEAKATVVGVRLPAGAAPIAGSSGFWSPAEGAGAFGDNYAYVNIAEWHEGWRVDASERAVMHAVAAGLGPGGISSSAGTSSSGTGQEVTASYETWFLPRKGEWFSERDLSVSVMAGPVGASTVVVAARVVWISKLLRIPLSARTATLALTPTGKVLGRVRSGGELRRIIAAVDALSPDEAVHAVYSCPALLGTMAPTELRMSFASADGKVLATLTTQWCPPDARLSVAGYGSLELSAGATFVKRIEAITGLALPVRSS